MVTGMTNNKQVITGCSQGDLMGKLEYSNNINHFLSGNSVDDYKFTEDNFSPFDVEYETTDRVDELKYRDISASEYLYSGYLFEYKKYQEMRKHKEKVYINFFNDVCLIWSIGYIPANKWCMMPCASNTQFGGYEEKKMKKVTKLYYDDATVLYRQKNGLYRSLNNDEKARCKEWLKKKLNNKLLGS